MSNSFFSRKEVSDKEQLESNSENWQNQSREGLEKKIRGEKRLEKEKTPDSQLEKRGEFFRAEQTEKELKPKREIGESVTEGEKGNIFLESEKKNTENIEINNLVKLGIRGEKEEKKAISRAKKMFRGDPHSLDVFHDQLIAKKRKNNI
jgi:hypothetical protein